MAENKREPLLLLPGLLCDEAVWKAQIRGLSDVAECMVAKLATQATIAAMADDALASIAGDFSLAGHSMGGYVALEIMRRAPERVRRLGLISTQPRADSTEQADRRRHFFEDALRGQFSEVVDGFPPLLFHPTRLSDATLVEAFREMAERVGKEAFLDQQRAIMGRVDSVADLAGISCPTLVLCGRRDLITPLTNSTLMAATIAGAEFVILEACGHMAPMEAPHAVNDALRSWLRRAPRPLPPAESKPR